MKAKKFAKTIGYQYNEADILKKFFGDRKGLVVEIGAADGIDNSNSYELVKQGWNALLVEPHPGFFRALQNLYKDNDRVQLSNKAISNIAGKRTFCLNNQCSSLKYILHGLPTIEVECITLEQLLINHGLAVRWIDFLSIDCEGEDLNVLKSLHWPDWQIPLVCVEHSMLKEDLDNFMKSVGYMLYDRNIGNSFYENSYQLSGGPTN